MEHVGGAVMHAKGTHEQVSINLPLSLLKEAFQFLTNLPSSMINLYSPLEPKMLNNTTIDVEINCQPSEHCERRIPI